MTDHTQYHEPMQIFGIQIGNWDTHIVKIIPPVTVITGLWSLIPFTSLVADEVSAIF